MARISLEDAAAAWTAGDIGVPTTPPTSMAPIEPAVHAESARYYKPLSDAALEYERWATTPNERILLGIDPIDAATGGIARGHLALLIGHSHNGKTQVLLHCLRNICVAQANDVLYFCPDEPRTLTLSKLVAIHHNIPTWRLEEAISHGDKDMIGMLHSTAENDFANLTVYDMPLVPSDLEAAYNEWCQINGREPSLVVIDYLDLVEAGETIPDKANYIKAFGRRHDIPLLCLHQTSRSAGSDGKALTISSGAYGGEQQATVMLAVRRKRYEIAARIKELQEKNDRHHSERIADEIAFWEREQAVHQYTLTISLVKNKLRSNTLVPETDFEIDTDTGRLYPMRQDELPAQYLREIGREQF
jgi:hypothetical protein